MNRVLVLSCLLIVTFLPYIAYGTPVCLEVSGESTILGKDRASAKIEAVNRAKWAAIEQVAGVELGSKTIVENAALLDDIITSQAQGVISRYSIVNEQEVSGAMKVVIKACVEPSRAKGAVSPLALNTALTIFIPAQTMTKQGKVGYDEDNILTHTLAGKLVDQGFTIRDLADTHAIKPGAMDSLLQKGDQTFLKSIIFRYLTNAVLLGRIETVLSTTKGDDIGYGIAMPFNSVTARLKYRLVTRDISGKIIVLASGSEEAKGLAPAIDDAYSASLSNLAEKFIPLVTEFLQKRLGDITTKIKVKVKGIQTTEQTFAFKDILQKVTWVSSVEESGIDSFWVTFPENPIYLANGLSQKGLRIIKYSRDEIVVQQ